MRIVKLVGAVLAGVWAFGCLLKIVGAVGALGRSDLGASRLLGSIVGLIVAGGISVLLFRSASKSKLASSSTNAGA